MKTGIILTILNQTFLTIFSEIFFYQKLNTLKKVSKSKKTKKNMQFKTFTYESRDDFKHFERNFLDNFFPKKNFSKNKYLQKNF